MPVLSSTVTDSFVHFMRNLSCPSARLFQSQPSIFGSARDMLHFAEAGLPDELHVCGPLRSRATVNKSSVGTAVCD
jgi:hypothetical protein